jgi:hypothetical protein
MWESRLLRERNIRVKTRGDVFLINNRVYLLCNNIHKYHIKEIWKEEEEEAEEKEEAVEEEPSTVTMYPKVLQV